MPTRKYPAARHIGLAHSDLCAICRNRKLYQKERQHVVNVPNTSAFYLVWLPMVNQSTLSMYFLLSSLRCACQEEWLYPHESSRRPWESSRHPWNECNKIFHEQQGRFSLIQNRILKNFAPFLIWRILLLCLEFCPFCIRLQLVFEVCSFSFRDRFVLLMFIFYVCSFLTCDLQL